MIALLVGRLRWMLCRRGAATSGGYVVSVSSLGDVILCVGSPVFRSLGWSW